MKRYKKEGIDIVDSHYRQDEKKWTLMEKLLLGLTPQQYVAQALRNPFNWILAAIFAVGIPIILGRFIFGLSWVTHSSNDYPWGLFLGFGLFAMVPLSSSGFQLGTTVEIFGRHDFEPIERLGLLNGLLGYFFAVVYLLVDLGQPWRLPYPMVVSFGPAAVLFLVAWHVATYLSVQVAEVSASFFEWIGFPVGKRGVRKITLGLTVAGIILSTLHQGALGHSSPMRRARYTLSGIRHRFNGCTFSFHPCRVDFAWLSPSAPLSARPWPGVVTTVSRKTWTN